MDWFNPLSKHLKLQGFPLVGAVDIDDVLGGEFKNHVARYDQWLDQGFDGEMGYLRRGRDRRSDPRLVFPEAQSVVCVATPYSKEPHGSVEADQGVQYARYLRGRDYHDVMPEKMQAALDALLTEFPELKANFRIKICVDTSAILERTWAALSGIGWIGKNTLLIHPQHGSYLLLGEILVNQKSHQKPKLHANFCGKCTRCLDACPTKAFTQAGELNSNRCISYWTLEKRGELNLSEEDQRAMGNRVAGCDICQEVCPFNNKAQAWTGDEQPSEWAYLQSEPEDHYKLRVKGSALNRVKPEMFKRNLELIKKT